VFTQAQYAWAHFVSADGARWTRLPDAITAPAWDGALSVVGTDVVAMYDSPPEPSTVRLARAFNNSDPTLLRWVKDEERAINITNIDAFPSLRMMFPSAIWSSPDGRRHFLAEVFTKTRNGSAIPQHVARFESTDSKLTQWRLADPAFARMPSPGGGRLIGEHSGAWFLPVPPPTYSRTTDYATQPTRERHSRSVGNRTSRYLLNSGGGEQFVLGDFDPVRVTFTNISATDRKTDYGMSLDWTAVGPATDGRVLQVGWLSNWITGRSLPDNVSRLSIVREIGYDRNSDGLVTNPMRELVTLRNGTAGSATARTVLRPGGRLVLAESGTSADVLVSFALPHLAGAGSVATFGVFVFAPPHKSDASDNGTSVLLRVWGNHTALLSVSVPPTAYVDAAAYNSASFSLSPGALAVDLRIVLDRSIVEVFAAGGRASITVNTFPDPGNVEVQLVASEENGVPVIVNHAMAYTMACGWSQEN